MVEKIKSLLENKDLSYKELKNILGVSYDILYPVITKMYNDGIIIVTSKDKYKLVEKTSIKKGIVKYKNNNVIVKIDKEEVIIPTYYVNDALENDIVLVDNIRDNHGKIVRILEKYNPNKACEVVIKNNIRYVNYNNELMELKGDNLDNITSGYMVLVKKSDDFKYAEVISLIGHKDAIDMNIIPYAYEYGFSDKFSNDVMDEVNDIPVFLEESVINTLLNEECFVDLRDKEIFTMDGVDTKDIDDAISLELVDGNFLLGVHIALPTYYVKRDGYIYQDIIERGNSAYPLGKVIPMNHPRLSNEICSLNEESDRLAISYFMNYDKNGKCKKVKICPSIIKSNKKMNYKDVNSILEDDVIPSGYEKYADTLKNMNILANILKDRMNNEGFLNYYCPEVKVNYDDKGNILFDKRSNKSSENLIEYFMLSTNEEVTKYLDRQGLKLIYRVDDKPNSLKLNSAISYLATKYPIKVKDNYNSEDIKKILSILKENPSEKVFNGLLIRCMARAKFSNINIGHYATGKHEYAMHTSPIRRAPDFINQMIIMDYLKYGVDYANMLWEDELEELANHFTETEKRQDELENKLLHIEMAKYLKNHIGEVFDGVISSVCDYGFYVEIDEIYEGLVGIRSLGDKMKFIPQIYSIMDKDTKEMYSLGDRVTIKIKSINEKYEIDFELMGVLNEKEKEKGKIKKMVL